MWLTVHRNSVVLRTPQWTHYLPTDFDSLLQPQLNTNTVYTLLFFSSKCSLFHNSNVFGSCIIHILYTGCAKIKKKLRRQKLKLKICTQRFYCSSSKFSKFSFSAHCFVTHVQTEKISSWNVPTVHVCCFILARASTKTFVSRVRKAAKKKSSLAEKFVSRVTR